jgi:hypothetical protein
LAEEKVTIAICCYGIFDPKIRSEEEMIGLEEYFEACAEYITELYSNNLLSEVILMGGRTNPQIPDVSEAESSASYLRTILSCLDVPMVGMRMRLEEEGCNTAQNLWYAANHVRPRGSFDASWPRPGLSKKIVFVCDNCHKVKLWLMVWHLARQATFKDLTFRVRSFPRRDIHPGRSYLRQLIATVPYLSPIKFLEDVGNRK